MPPNLDNLSDESLAAAARARSPQALAHFEEIVRRYQSPLHRFLAKRFPSRRDLDDILQESFLKAWQSIHLFNPRYALRTWLYTIAYRTAVSHGRQDRAAQPLSPSLAATAPSPAARLERQDHHLSLWQTAREILPEEQFTVLWLHYVDELPAPDIARILNRSWVSVKTLLHRARKKLQPHIHADQNDKHALEVAEKETADDRSAATLRSGPSGQALPRMEWPAFSAAPGVHP